MFSGIGGFELGLRRAGHSLLLLCEIDPAARAVLKLRFPGVPIAEDIRDLTELPADTDFVCAGFPCQDLSQAGKTSGIEGVNSGLIGNVFRLLRQKPVPRVLLENVPFMLHLNRGRAMTIIVEELERLGYSWAYRIVDSRAFGLPQRRQRVFVLASNIDDPRDALYSKEAGEPIAVAAGRTIACGFYWTEGNRGLGWGVNAVPPLKGGSRVGIPSPPAVLLPDGRIVTPGLTDAERLQGFPANWTRPAELAMRKNHRWALIGNAVTVGVARWIGVRLASPGLYKQEADDAPLTPGAAWPQAAYNVGSGRFHASVSMWPVRRKQKALGKFIRRPSPLPLRATGGFLRRALASSLHFPDGFLSSVALHLQRMEREATRSRRRR